MQGDSSSYCLTGSPPARALTHSEWVQSRAEVWGTVNMQGPSCSDNPRSRGRPRGARLFSPRMKRVGLCVQQLREHTEKSGSETSRK